MNFQQLIRELHWLEWRLRSFEDKYGVRSWDFYQAMEAGQLSEFDDVEDPRFYDFLECVVVKDMMKFRITRPGWRTH